MKSTGIIACKFYARPLGSRILPQTIGEHPIRMREQPACALTVSVNRNI